MISGFLKIYKIVEGQDWQRLGNWENKRTGIVFAPYLSLIPFFFSAPSGLTVSEFKIRKVSGDRLTKIIGTTVSLTTSWLVANVGVYETYWTFNANNDITFPGCGVWEFYIKFSDTSEYVSELFFIPNAGDMYECLPDFNDDFNNDFNTCL
jgi:hypothetical protein